MPSSVGPYQTRGSNLVFAYDVGDVVNSYIGEPTTNLLPTPSINTLPTYGNSWGTYNTNQYNGGNYFSIGTISSVSSNIVTTVGNHPLRTYDVVNPQTTGGGVTANVNYFVKKISNTQFSLHAYNSSQDGSQGYINTSTGYPVVWNSIALDQRVSINASSFPTMWWGYPHLPNSGLVKEIIPKGYTSPYAGPKTDCIRLNWIRPDGVTDGMSYGVDASITPNQTVCCSFWMKAVSASAVGQVVQFYHYTYGVTSATDYYMNATIGPLGEWRRYSYTFNSPNNVAISYWFPGTGNMIVDIANIQIEQKTHATPFIAGTRSNTQGLLDISGYNKSIPLNTSYDANAIMYFDGTDDYISIPNTTSFGTFTAEVVIKPTAYPGNAASAISTEYPGSNSTVNFTLGFEGSTFMGGFYNGSSGGWHQIFTSLPTLNVYSHYVLTFNGAQMIMYKNGVSVGTFTTNDIAAGGNPIRIGRRWDIGDYFPGRIDVAKVYNRALSQSEITTNYNSYKKRFNLS